MSTAQIARSNVAGQLMTTLSTGLLSLLQRRGRPPAACAPQQLDKGRTAWIRRPLGCTVRCETGTLWLTFDGEPLDLILEAGQSHCCDKASRLGIHAMSAARVTVSPAGR